MVDLGAFAESYPRDLSGGMRQRLALARALAVEPECLLLDEPLAALDLPMRHLLQDKLLQLWRHSGKTVIAVSHDLEEALYLSDRVMVMRPRPGSIHQVFQVPFPRPRQAELRLSDEFQAFKRHVSQSIKLS